MRRNRGVRVNDMYFVGSKESRGTDRILSVERSGDLVQFSVTIAHCSPEASVRTTCVMPPEDARLLAAQLANVADSIKPPQKVVAA